ncbi:MAG: phosphoribosyltransferase family protein [Patescibacteria group bacterium]
MILKTKDYTINKITSNYFTMSDVIQILKKVGAILPNDHFVGTSGLHIDTYINKDMLYLHTRDTSEICKMFAEKYKDQNIEAVVGPAVGGIILSQWTAYHLSEITGKEVLALYTEKDADKNQVFTRGYDKFAKGKRILFVEDLVTTGGSVMKAIKSVEAVGGIVAGVCVMVNKNPTQVNKEHLGVEIDALSVYEVATFEADACPMCKSAVPVNVTVGHGKKFLESKK